MVLEPAIKMLTNTSDLDSDAEILSERLAGLYAQLEAFIADNVRYIQNQQEYNGLNNRYEKVKTRLAETITEKQSRMARLEQINRFIEVIRSRDALLTEFDENLWRALVENIRVHPNGKIVALFRDGREITAKT